MTQKYTFTAVIQNAGGGGAYVEIPFDVEKAFGSKRPRVKALIEGIPYRGTLMRMQTECHILGIRKEIREQVGKSFGDEVEVTVQEDTEPRVVDIPADLIRAFEREPEAKIYFEKISYTHQKEYMAWIEEAKKEATRQKRVASTIEMLKQKSKAGTQK